MIRPPLPEGWSNPFLVGRDGSSAEVIAKHKRWLHRAFIYNPAFADKVEALLAFDLSCGCARGERCHVDNLRDAVAWLVNVERVIICGGRNFTDRRLAYGWLDSWWATALGRKRLFIAHGAADGADLIADQWGRDRGHKVCAYPARWDDIDRPGAKVRRRRDGTLYDAGAGPRRNREMFHAHQPAYIVAMPGGAGTADMVEYGARNGAPTVWLTEWGK